MLRQAEINRIPQVVGTNVFILDDALEQNLFAELLRSFPRDSMAREDVHKKVALNKYNTSEMEQFLSKNTAWKSFVEYFNSADFLFFLNRLNDNNNDAHRDFCKDEINIGYEFSILKNDSQVVPHKDKYGKLYSFVFYFVDKRWECENSYGGTQFYKPKNRLLNLKFFNGESTFQSMELQYEVEPRSNRLMIFQPNEMSWHGVDPIKTEDTCGRPAFIVTVHRRETISERFMNLLSPITGRVQRFL